MSNDIVMSFAVGDKVRVTKYSRRGVERSSHEGIVCAAFLRDHEVVYGVTCTCELKPDVHITWGHKFNELTLLACANTVTMKYIKVLPDFVSDPDELEEE